MLIDIKSVWELLFGSDTGDLTTLQMMVRAFITFLIALILIRFAGIRSFGKKSAFDIVVSITFGAVLSRCITGHYSFIGCIAAIAVLALMHRLVAFLAMHNPRLEKLIKGDSDVIFKNNKIIWEKMKRHNITRKDLIETLHKNGLFSTDEIEKAYFETDGKITIIPKIKTLLPETSRE